MYLLKIKFYLGGSFFMKKFVSLKLIIFSFFLVFGSIIYLVILIIEVGIGIDSIEVGIDNEVSKEKSLVFGYKNIVDGEESLVFGFSNIVSGKRSLVFGYSNKVSGERSFVIGYNNEVIGFESLVFGNNYKVIGNYLGVFGIGIYDEVNRVYKCINGGGNLYMIGNDNNIVKGVNDNFILGNGVDIGVDSNGWKIEGLVVLGYGFSVFEFEVVFVGIFDGGRRIVNVCEVRIIVIFNDVIIGK